MLIDQNEWYEELFYDTEESVKNEGSVYVNYSYDEENKYMNEHYTKVSSEAELKNSRKAEIFPTSNFF